MNFYNRKNCLIIIDRIPFIGFLLWIVFIIIQLQALFNFYSRIDKSIAILIAILGAIPPTSPIAIIYLFTKRNTKLDQVYEIF